jgi:hypothetical protein
MRVLVLAVFALAGCTPAETYELHVRDSSAASVEFETATGMQVLLPPGRTVEERTLPRTSPPYGTTALFEASAIRDAHGAITMRCDACLDVPLVHLVPPEEGTTTLIAHTLPGDMPDLVWTPESLRVRLAYPYFQHERRYTHGPFVAFRYDLVVPRDALVEVRKKREDLHGRGWIYLLIGALMSAGSTALIVDGANRFPPPGNHDATGPLFEIVGGILLITPSVVLDIAGLAYIAAPGGYDERIGP